MLIEKKLNDALNAQIVSELGASSQYLKIASYFAGESLHELAEFFFRQSEEEREHAMKFVHYILEAGGDVQIGAIEGAPATIGSAVEAVKLALDWELEVTRQINHLMDIAIEEKDYIGQDFLRWFVTEQLEEVSTMDELLTIVKRAGENLFYVENYLSRRSDPHTSAQ
ncbi:MAG: ferritin [Anaerolineales bacterium]|nr:ferritin [Anaerolineales bacterium]